VVIAMTIGILALAIARTLRRYVADEWFFGLAGAGSVGFALAFLALVNRWIQLERRPFHPPVLLWLCFYFGFSAICMLGLALRVHRLAPSPIRPVARLTTIRKSKTRTLSRQRFVLTVPLDNFLPYGRSTTMVSRRTDLWIVASF
jgi:hypothetical protein